MDRFSSIKKTSPETIQPAVGPGFLEVLARTTGYDTLAMVCELTDNAVEANSTCVDVSLLQKGKDYEFRCLDNGRGMSREEIATKFFTFLQFNFKERGVHAGMGVASISSSIDTKNGGVFQMVTHKQGHPAVWFEWDGHNNTKVATIEDSDIPYGTDMRITKVKAKTEIIEKLRGILPIRYHRVEGVDFTFNGEQLEQGAAADPLYMHYVCEESTGWEYSAEKYKTAAFPNGTTWQDLRYDEVIEVIDDDGITHNVRILARDMSEFPETFNNLIYRDRAAYNDYSNSLMCKEYSGIYLTVDNITIKHGNGLFRPYVPRNWHQAACGIRAEICIPQGLALKLNYNLNKTKGFADTDTNTVFDQIGQRLKDVIEIFIQRKVKRNEDKSKVKAMTYNRVYKDGNEEITFKVTDESRIPRSVFAIKSSSGNGFEYNINSTVAKKTILKDGSMGKFDVVADTASLSYMAVVKACRKVAKIQPPINPDLSPNQQARETRDFMIETLLGEIENNFMSITIDD